MIDRDTLIEGAAKAICKAHVEESTYGDFAAAALAVFEKAHTPTDDERRDLIAFLLRDHNFEESPWGRTYTDAEIANALRHSVVPEPQSEPSNRVIVMCARCGLFPVVGGDEINSDIVVCDRCAFAEGRESAQGEPSDARSRTVAHTGPGHASGDAGYCEGCLTDREQRDSNRIPGEPFTLEDLAREHERLVEHPNQMSQTVPAFHALTAKALRWAALRAAGGVR
ncbi:MULTISPECIES: hypothetical protein [unclassified Microbacterium]|uniref:hypothetical protein n=1 Tax=unclassified Microbacterium TaxID=2609290 RepID=UPI0010F9C9FC|nr:MULTISPECIES: hypothetical protein [unclassified Microbacterium]